VLINDNKSHIIKSNNSLEELVESVSEKNKISKNDILVKESKKKCVLTKKALVKKEKIL
jgi:hypothetical protein